MAGSHLWSWSFLNLRGRLICRDIKFIHYVTISTNFSLRTAGKFFLTMVHPYYIHTTTTNFQKMKKSICIWITQETGQKYRLLESLKWWLSQAGQRRVGLGWEVSKHLGCWNIHSSIWAVATQMYKYVKIHWTGRLLASGCPCKELRSCYFIPTISKKLDTLKKSITLLGSVRKERTQGKLRKLLASGLKR